MYETTGADLKAERVALGVSAARLAVVAGWKSHSTVFQIEARALVPPKTAAKYRTALAMFRTVRTGEAA